MLGLCFTRTEKIKFYTNAVRYTEQNPNYLKTEYDILEGTLNQNVYLASKRVQCPMNCLTGLGLYKKNVIDNI